MKQNPLVGFQGKIHHFEDMLFTVWGHEFSETQKAFL